MSPWLSAFIAQTDPYSAPALQSLTSHGTEIGVLFALSLFFVFPLLITAVLILRYEQFPNGSPPLSQHERELEALAMKFRHPRPK